MGFEHARRSLKRWLMRLKLTKLQRAFTLFILFTLCLPAASAAAQETALLTISPPDTSQFPTVTTLFDAFDAQGNFITGLTPNEVVVLENGEKLSPDAVEDLRPALVFAVAVNSGPALAVRDGFGFSRYDKMMAVLKNWASARPAENPDNLALVWNGGIVTSRVDPIQWWARLDTFDPDLRNADPGLAALAYALDTVQQTETPPTGKKAVLLLSSHLDTDDVAGLPDLTARAVQAGIRVYVWVCDSKSFFTHPGTLALQEMAIATGGRFLTFSGEETLPDPEEWISTLRHGYRLTYTSAIRQGGEQSLIVQATGAGETLTSLPQNFQFDVQAPNPALLSPPIQIVRQNPEDPFNFDSFQPRRQEIAILVEFPDGFKRPLTRTTLYVDGQEVDENVTEPFDTFNWPLDEYVATAEHSLQVEVEDSLGLVRMSAPVPVQVTVIQPPGGITGLILRNRTAVTLSAVVLAGAVLLGILFFGGRRTLSALAERRRLRARNLDPVTQPVVDERSKGRANPFPWLRRKAPAPAAYFAKLTPDGQPAPGDPIPLVGHELTFGTDPTQATIVLDHPSLSSLHARLRHYDDGTFVLLDQNSVAGTWVNYDPTPKDGRILRHGDVVHFGQLTYRFVLTKPPATKKPTIAPIHDG